MSGWGAERAGQEPVSLLLTRGKFGGWASSQRHGGGGGGGGGEWQHEAAALLPPAGGGPAKRLATNLWMADNVRDSWSKERQKQEDEKSRLVELNAVSRADNIYVDDFDLAKLEERHLPAEQKVEIKDKNQMVTYKDKKPKADCHVCGDTAVAHMHYGGTCCYSCKAFFRRAAQSGKDTKYKCFTGRNSCEVRVGNRRNCQRCRFQKCVSIGMKTSWILSDEQCQMRFKKKRSLKGMKVGCPGRDKLQKHCPVLVAKSEPKLYFTREEMNFVENMLTNYAASKEMFSFSGENSTLWSKLFGDRGQQEAGPSRFQYSALDFGHLINTVIKKNIFFLSSNKHFQSLTEADQLVLLLKNTAEICHLRGAIRFDSSSNNFIWYWSDKDKMQLSYQKDSGNGEKTVKNMFIDKTQLSTYLNKDTSSQLFKTLGKFCNLGFPTEAFLILIHLVYFASDGIDLQDRSKVENCQSIYFLLFHRFLSYLFGEKVGRMKLSQAMGCLMDIREVADVSKMLRGPQ